MERSTIRKIMLIMADIGRVEYRMHNEFIGLYKDQLLFAKIIDAGDLYLFKNGSLVKIDASIDKNVLKSRLHEAYNNII